MLWPVPLHHWFGETAPPLPKTLDDRIGERLRDVVSEHTRVKADESRCYDARVQSMIGALFSRMDETLARPDP